MTEKRFKIDVASELDENAVFCNDEFICLVDDTDNLVKVFNYLVNENEQLKSDLDYFQRTYEIEERGLDIVTPMCTIGSPTLSRLELFKENEQLSRECESLTIKKQELELEIIRLEDIIKTGKRRRAVDKEKEQRMFLVDKEKEQRMFFVDMEKQRKMFR